MSDHAKLDTREITNHIASRLAEFPRQQEFLHHYYKQDHSKETKLAVDFLKKKGLVEQTDYVVVREGALKGAVIVNQDITINKKDLKGGKLPNLETVILRAGNFTIEPGCNPEGLVGCPRTIVRGSFICSDNPSLGATKEAHTDEHGYPRTKTSGGYWHVSASLKGAPSCLINGDFVFSHNNLEELLPLSEIYPTLHINGKLDLRDNKIGGVGQFEFTHIKFGGPILLDGNPHIDNLKEIQEKRPDLIFSKKNNIDIEGIVVTGVVAALLLGAGLGMNAYNDYWIDRDKVPPAISLSEGVQLKPVGAAAGGLAEECSRYTWQLFPVGELSAEELQKCKEQATSFITYLNTKRDPSTPPYSVDVVSRNGVFEMSLPNKTYRAITEQFSGHELMLLSGQFVANQAEHAQELQKWTTTISQSSTRDNGTATTTGFSYVDYNAKRAAETQTAQLSK